MATRDLVGRPLVPFFDSDENVNDSMELGEGDDEREDMDVDARVWDKELGYFVYPSEQQAAGSKPVPIASSNRDSRTDSGAKLLLTPSMMLSNSAPERSNSMAASGNPVQAPTDGASTRSSSAKRGSKQKTRTNTPGRRRKDKEAGEDTSSKKGKNKGANGNGVQSSSHKSSGGKQLSSSGKWAWSAFQSSPDPAQLPMPPFLTKPGAGLSNGSSAAATSAPPLPPTPPPPRNVPIAPPLPPGPPPSQPLQPPLPAGPPPEVATPAPMSIELSMTQDLRRMLNIGGGSKAFGELLTAGEASDGQQLPKVCPTSPALGLMPQKKSISPRAGVCPSPGMHHNPFLDAATWPFSVSRGPTSTSPAFVTKSYNNGTTPGDSCAMFTPPTPNKRVCSQQGFTQSKAGATATSGNWAPSLTQARKRSLGAFDAAHFASASPSDKRASLSIEMNLESRSNAVSGALSSCSSSSSTPSIAVLPRGSASAPKRMYPPQQRRSRNPGNLSLDLSQVDQANFDPCTTATGASKRRNDQAAICSKLTDFLYIGGAVAAKNKSMLIQTGITHVINCAASVAPASFPDEFCYFNIRLRDHSSQDIARHFYSMFDFIERARECGGRIFLHCVKGISRSPTMAIAYLMWYKNIGMYKALDFVRQARPIVDPNAGFIFQLTEWEQLHPEGRIKFQRTIIFRVEVARDNSVEKNSNCGSIVLANKPLFVGPLPRVGESYFRDPTKDLGGVSLIVACADYMFVWCGSDVAEDLVEAAENGAQILQRYEAFPAKCDTVRQGQEPVAFWDLVGDEI